MLFIDADVHFNPMDVLDLIIRDFDVGGAPYPKKSISWKNVALAARKHPDLDPSELANVIGDFVFNVASGTTKISVNEPLEVLEIGTGMESRATFPDLPEHIQTVIVHPHATPYELLKALTFFLYYVVPSIFLPFMTDVDADQCLEGIDGLFLLQDVKDFQAMMQLAAGKRMSHAAKRGKLEWIIHLRQTGHLWDSNTSATAAEGGHLACLQYLHDNDCFFLWSDATAGAAAGGHLACLQYLHDNGYRWGQVVCDRAAAGGHLACLQYLHANGCPWDVGTSLAAAEGGHLACLQYLHANGCPWGDAIVCRAAAKHGHLACLQYLHTNGAGGLSENYSFDMVWVAIYSYQEMNALETACYGNQFDCFRYLHEQGYSSRLNLCELAAHSKSMQCLKYACEVIGDQLDQDFLGMALNMCAYECFKFAYENGCPVPPVVISGSLPDWFSSSRLVRECAPVPPEAILRCLTQVHRDTILHPAPAPSSVRKTLAFLEYGEYMDDKDEDEEMDDEDEDEEMDDKDDKDDDEDDEE